MFGHHRHHFGRRFAHDRDEPAAEGESRGGRFGRHGPWGHDRHGGRDSRGRVFDQGELRLVILALIAEQPRHGYEIIKAIEERLGGGYSPSPGVIYPTLTLLHEMGFATVSETGGGRKLYAITEEGQADLATHKATAEAIFTRMDRTAASSSGNRAPQVVRAVQNMKTALHMRLSRGPLGEPEAQAIADALDAAARAIERA
jgi:DNA-binding PadR family transcriptional regulator